MAMEIRRGGKVGLSSLITRAQSWPSARNPATDENSTAPKSASSRQTKPQSVGSSGRSAASDPAGA